MAPIKDQQLETKVRELQHRSSIIQFVLAIAAIALAVADWTVAHDGIPDLVPLLLSAASIWMWTVRYRRDRNYRALAGL